MRRLQWYLLAAIAVLLNGMGGFAPPVSAQQATWVQRDLATANVRALIADPSQPGHLYAGGESYQQAMGYRNFFSSTDGGATWSQGNSGPRNTSVMALALNPSHSQTLYAGNNLNGLFESTDGGTTWTVRNSGLPTPLPTIYAVIVDPTNPPVLYLATGTSGIFRSGDGARSWQKLSVTNGSCDFHAVSIVPNAPRSLYAGGSCGVFKSTNAGGTWQPLSNVPAGVFASAATPDRIDVLSEPSLNTNTIPGLWQSAGSGTSWQHAGAGNSLSTVLLDPSDPNTIFVAGSCGQRCTGDAAGNNRVQVSRDGGATWSTIGGIFPSNDLNTLLLVGSTLLVGARGGVWELTLSVSAPHDQRYFAQTGFRIDNATIWDYFQRRGGVPIFGYPTSRTFPFQGFTVQFFQRRIVQLGPDGQARLLNLLDPGLLNYSQFNGSTFPAVDSGLVSTAPDPTNQPAVLAWVRQHAPDSVGGNTTNFFHTFSTTVSAQTAFPNGGDPSLLPGIELELWGVPTSGAFTDPNNHNFVYLRWQRGIMLYDAGTGLTQGILLADYLKAILTGQNLPADVSQEAQGSSFFGQYDPTRPKWIHNPSLLPNTDLTDAFTQE